MDPSVEELPSRAPSETRDRVGRDRAAGFAVAPRTLARRRRSRILPVLLALALLGVGLAVAKPWGEVAPRVPGAVIEFRSPGLPDATLAPGQTFAGPDAGLPTAAPTPYSADLFPADYDVEPVSPGLVTNAGRWGLGTGGWWSWSRTPWSWWQPAVPASDGTAVGPVDCGSTTRLPAGLFIAITAPGLVAARSEASVVAVDDVGVERPIDVFSVSTPADRGNRFFVRESDDRWPVGSYRVRLDGSGGTDLLEICLFTVERTSSTGNELFPLGAVPRALREWAARNDSGVGPAGDAAGDASAAGNAAEGTSASPTPGAP